MSTQVYRALVLDGARRLRLTDVTRAPLARSQVRLRVVRAGVCGSDYSSIAGRLPFTQFPIVPGHEMAGEVIESASAEWDVGDRVVVNPVIVRRDDPVFGRTDRHHADSVEVLGVVSRDGAFADEVVVEDYMLRRIPDTLDWEAAALIEPVAVAVRAVERGGGARGQRVLLLGAGSIGLLALQVARADGAAFLAITDVVPERLEIARDLGADATVEIGPDGSAKAPLHDFDVVIDGVGNQGSIELAVDACRRGGSIAVYGVPSASASLSLARAFRSDLSISMSRLYGSDIQRAIELVASGAVDGRLLVSDRIPLAEAAAFLIAVLDGERQALKAQIVP